MQVLYAKQFCSLRDMNALFLLNDWFIRSVSTVNIPSESALAVGSVIWCSITEVSFLLELDIPSMAVSMGLTLYWKVEQTFLSYTLYHSTVNWEMVWFAIFSIICYHWILLTNFNAVTFTSSLTDWFSTKILVWQSVNNEHCYKTLMVEIGWAWNQSISTYYICFYNREPAKYTR